MAITTDDGVRRLRDAGYKMREFTTIKNITFTTNSNIANNTSFTIKAGESFSVEGITYTFNPTLIPLDDDSAPRREDFMKEIVNKDELQALVFKQQDYSDVDIRAPRLRWNQPWYCIECSLGKKERMTAAQMYDHLLLVHQPRGHKVPEDVMENMQAFATRFKAWKASVKLEREQSRKAG